jgi:RHS repeat-associated protein
VQTRSYYGADGKLRAQQGYHELGGMYFTGERRGYFSEYRYDALGRRVLVRTRRDGLCQTTQTNTVDCTSGIERFVWAGDNILWEMRGPGASTEAADRLEQEYAMGVEYGIVGYTHAGGVDRPLVTYKTNGGNSGAVVVPHMNWRGLFSLGTNPSGGASTTPVEWPGFRTTANHSMGETQSTTKNWMGSLLEGQRDASGLMYMRNRYYDPQTGQFTQTDPISIAGGLNTYGFAAGDPVGNWDPFGTCAWGIGPDAAHGRCSGMEPQDPWAENSSCRVYKCALRPAWPHERRFVEQRLSTLRTDLEFCQMAARAGLEMANRQLAMFDNDVRDEDSIPIWGNAPMNARLGGVVMYLHGPGLRRLNGRSPVHEAIHGLINPARAIQPTYYTDRSTTPFGLSVDQSAAVCTGDVPYPGDAR